MKSDDAMTCNVTNGEGATRGRVSLREWGCGPTLRNFDASTETEGKGNLLCHECTFMGFLQSSNTAVS